MIYDVIVIGGGTAGAIAAIQAGRLGARTALIEMTCQLGGTMTHGGVHGAAYFWSPLRQIIKGIGWEIVQKNLELGGPKLPPYTTRNPNRPSYHTSVNPSLWALLTEEECLKAHVDIHYLETPTDIRDNGDGTWTVRTAGKNTQNTFVCKELIDATGDANAVRLAGLPLHQDENRQPATLVYRLAGVDFDAVDEAELEANYQAALASGELHQGDYCFKDKPFMTFLKNGGANLQHIIDCDTATSEDAAQTSIRGRQSLLRMLRFVRRQKGCENVTVQYMAAQAFARDTWRIVGEHTVTYEEYMAATVFPDAVCYTLYFIDIHHEDGIHHEFLPPEKVPTLPLSALIPKGSSRILVAGRILSADRRAHSALRIEATCMATGQAAGAAAALGALQGIPSRRVPIGDIRQTLRDNGALVP